MISNTGPEDTDPYRDQVEEIVALQDSDPVFAFDALKALAPRSVVAQLMLGLAYGQGLGTAVDTAAEEECYKRAAEQGSPTALFNLGVNSCAREDYPKALEYYRQAAALGGSNALEAWEELKEWVDLREANDLALTDPVRAHAAYRALAEAGSMQGMFRLGWMSHLGFGADKDLKQAAYWYQRVFDEGSDEDKEMVVYHLGRLAQDLGDYAKAYDMYKYGIDRGVVRTFYKLGELYENGLGVKKDPRKARSLYEHGANLGSMYALRNLAWQDLSGHFGLINFFRGIPRLLRSLAGLSASMEKRGDMWIETSN